MSWKANLSVPNIGYTSLCMFFNEDVSASMLCLKRRRMEPHTKSLRSFFASSKHLSVTAELQRS